MPSLYGLRGPRTANGIWSSTLAFALDYAKVSSLHLLYLNSECLSIGPVVARKCMSILGQGRTISTSLGKQWNKNYLSNQVLCIWDPIIEEYDDQFAGVSYDEIASKKRTNSAFIDHPCWGVISSQNCSCILSPRPIDITSRAPDMSDAWFKLGSAAVMDRVIFNYPIHILLRQMERWIVGREHTAGSLWNDDVLYAYIRIRITHGG